MGFIDDDEIVDSGRHYPEDEVVEAICELFQHPGQPTLEQFDVSKDLRLLMRKRIEKALATGADALMDPDLSDSSTDMDFDAEKVHAIADAVECWLKSRKAYMNGSYNNFVEALQ